MTELVFYDQRLPLKRKWSEGAAAAPPLQPLRPLPQQLPRLPSLSAWVTVKSVGLTPPVSSLASLPSTVSPPRPTETAPPPSPPKKREEASAPPAKRTAPMRNTSRERMKAEQASLRAQAASLETELACLQQMRHARLAASLRSSETPSESLVGWQQMAQRHWDQRVASERENKRLREAVNGLAGEVKGLESLFNSRSSALMASLKQNAQLAVQLQEMLVQCDTRTSKRPITLHASPRRPSRVAKDKKTASQPQHSPRDVACAMEAPPQSPF